MTYNATYTSDDIAPASIDTIVSVIAIFASFSAIVGLVVLYRWLSGKRIM